MFELCLRLSQKKISFKTILNYCVCLIDWETTKWAGKREGVNWGTGKIHTSFDYCYAVKTSEFAALKFSMLCLLEHNF